MASLPLFQPEASFRSHLQKNRILDNQDDEMTNILMNRSQFEGTEFQLSAAVNEISKGEYGSMRVLAKVNVEEIIKENDTLLLPSAG